MMEIKSSLKKYVLKVLGFLILSFPLVLSAQNLSLQEALNITWQNNYGLQIISKQQEITELQNHAGYAGMLPVVSAIANYNVEVTNSEQTYFSGDTRSEKNAGANALDAGVYLNWTIFDGFGMFAKKEKLEQLVSLGELQVKANMEETALNVMTYYNTIIQLEHGKSVLQNALDVSNERFRISSQRNAIGSASGLDVLQAKVDLNADSSAYINVLLQIKNAKAQLNELMGREPQTQFEVNTQVELDKNLNYNTLVTQLSSNNTAVLLAEKNKQIAAIQVKEYKSYLWPTVSLNAGYSFLRSISEAGFVESNLNVGPGAGISIVIPLFNGFTYSRDIEQIKVMQEMMALDVQQTQLSVNTKLLTLYNQYETALQLVELESKNIDAATENVNIALEKFNLGAITSFDLREIQLQKINAENRKLTEELNAKLAELQIKYLTSTILTQ